MVKFVNKLQKSEEKGHSISHFYIMDHRETHLVCMCRSTTHPFKTAIVPTIRLIWLPWQLYGENEEKMYLPLQISKILITERQMWYVRIGLQLLALPNCHFT